jgi:hypothetical protein
MTINEAMSIYPVELVESAVQKEQELLKMEKITVFEVVTDRKSVPSNTIVPVEDVMMNDKGRILVRVSRGLYGLID